ncbi:TonB-dependent receptor domain-containing protein [Solitalea lacus]|uniref:TonB-dependent receptor domain-containing protein n=1 Tax=Solitalea lacus TaxID=2911172 RepID=UPI001EDC527D|nr:outer membrane beta-barrel family protein [Solitalea lacus]UKJ06998.1 TonB-dependent receptor [Solitalea lacus]
MKKVLLFSLFSLLAAIGYAQMPGGAAKGSGKVSGVVLDSVNQKPVEFATIALLRWADSKSVNGGLTDEKGSFKLIGIANGEYKLVVSFIGYHASSTKKIVVSDANNDLKLGKVLLRAEGKQLNEVTVVGQKALVENKIDKMVYNAEKDVTSKGGDAGDVLRKVPMVSVDMDGNVELRGSSNVRVLINGKPSTIVSNNVADAMKMIPADQIKNVEVITSPSAKYDAEGSAGIINIVTKKTDVAGVTGNISLNVGTRFNRGNGNINFKRGKLGFNSGFSGMYLIPQNGANTFTRTDYSDASNIKYSNQNGTGKSDRKGGSVNFGVDYEINKTNNITSSIKVNNWGNGTGAMVLATQSNSVEGVQQAFNRNSINNSGRTGIDWTTDYRKTFKKPQQELGLSFQLSKDKNQTDYESIYDGVVNFPDSAERSFNDGANRELTLQADYAHPISKKLLLETGAKSILRDITSNSIYEVLSPLEGYLPVVNRSNQFDYAQNVFAGYASFALTLEKGYAIKAGGRFERTEISGSFVSSELNSINNGYNTFIPSVTLAKTFKDLSSLKLSYSQRIQRPGLRFLNPFVDATDPQNISFGNPYLSPEKTNSFELGYSKFMGKTSVNASVYYKNTFDIIESVVGPVPGRSEIYGTTYMNIAGSSSVGVNLFGSVQLGQYFTLRGNANVYTYNVDDSNIKTTYSNSSVLYSINGNASWNLPQNFAIEMFGMFNSPRRTIQGQNPSFSMFNIGFKKEFMEKRASLGLNLSNPFSKNREFISKINGNGFDQYSERQVPFRSIGVSLSYRFGKMDFGQGSSGGQRKGKGQGGKKNGINNDDIKQEEDSQGGGGGMSN